MLKECSSSTVESKKISEGFRLEWERGGNREERKRASERISKKFRVKEE